MAGLTLVTGDAGSGKTARLVEIAAEHYAADPFAPLLVLVPTARHADQFRRRLVERASAVFHLHVLTLNQFARGQAGSRLLPPDIAAELLARVTRDRAAADGPASRLRPIAHTGGLHALVRAAVADLVADAIDPAALQQAARATTSLDLRALAEVYEAYRAALDGQGRHDPGEAVHVAATIVDGGANLPARVLVDGVQFLRGGEVNLVAALARRTNVWCAIDPDAGTRPEWTMEALRTAMPDARTEALTSSSEMAATEAFTVADAESQLREIARAIKTRLDADPTLRASDCAVVFRRVTPHLALARRVFQEMNLPLDPAAGDRLAERPFGTWLLRLLRLGARDWRVFDLLDVASADFMDSSALGVEADALTSLRGLVRWRKLWAGRDSVRRLPQVAQAEGRGDDARAASALAALVERIASAFDAEAMRRPGEHAAVLEALLFGAGGLLAGETQDYPTLGDEVGVLRSELASVRAVDEALSGTPERFSTFVGTLEARLQRPATLIRQPGGVLLAPMHTLHGLRFKYVAVAGLNEGEIPAPRRAEGFLNTAARAALEARGLALPPEPRASEAELWQTATTRATETTTLWRTHLDAKGRQAAPSFFFDLAVPRQDVRAVESATPADRAVSTRELAVALVRGWPGEARRPAGMVAWDRVVRVAAPIEQRRRSYQPAGRHEGVLPGIDVAWLLDPAAGWSASRLESYRTCSFQFFGGYVLGLREVDEERSEVDAGTRGTVIHAILEDAVQDLAASNRPLNPETVEEAVSRLRTNARTIWDAAPGQYAFGRAALWRYEGPRAITQMERLLRREAAANALLPLTRVVGGEAAFLEVLPGDPPLRVQARIDRLDEGDGVIQIVDYKSGRFMRRKSAEDGDRLQLQIYAHAARQAHQAERVVARYAFLGLKPNETEWTLDSDRPGDTAILDFALEVARGAQADIGAGHFEVAPRVATCPTYCAFINACRVSHYSRRKWDGDA